MNAPTYSVVTTAHFDRLMKKLAPKHPELLGRFEEALAILAADPYNKSRKFAIKKLEGISPSEGQYRLRSGRFRFRYEVADRDVVLPNCGLRREEMD
ncbi:MAG: hypothetical protein KGL37_10420 [Acidobacteriota bacterium]|nr:hypothetical protein [Acidobacteriota bacterium]